ATGPVAVSCSPTTWTEGSTASCSDCWACACPASRTRVAPAPAKNAWRKASCKGVREGNVCNDIMTNELLKVNDKERRHLPVSEWTAKNKGSTSRQNVPHGWLPRW